jgi:Protein of unknown function (DUF2934)
MTNKNNVSVTPKPRTPKREVSVESISQRAYQLFEARGSSEAGQAVEDWLKAERELHAVEGVE